MTSQLAQAAGHLSVLIAPALLAWAAWIEEPLLVFGAVMLVFPLARIAFGAVDEAGPPAWSEGIAAALDRLPWVYAAVLAGAVLMLLLAISRSEPTMGTVAGWALSLWVTMVFATCVAHELLHRKRKSDRIVGHLLAGLAGYPVLGYEHSRHHQRVGSCASAECPKVTDSVWQFAARRIAAIVHESLGARGLALAGDSRSPAVQGLRVALATTGVTLALFGLAAGWPGVLIYALVIGLVAFAVQLVTYMQHWGLGDDNIDDARQGQYGWEDDCRFQAWVTMGLSLHQAHHRNGSRPYYRTGITDGLSAPAGRVRAAHVRGTCAERLAAGHGSGLGVLAGATHHAGVGRPAAGVRELLQVAG
ncbi:MAG: fatty acid desaturase [Rubrivivax sp.]|nr:fatty acid desaturase [Rubrivivax sp.]